MPRLRPLTRADRLTRILFERTTARIPNTELAKATGRASSTIGRWKGDPEGMPLGAAIDIAKATGMTDDAWLQILRG